MGHSFYRRGFPLYWWCQCGILDHYGMWPDVSYHDILMNVWRGMLGVPPGTRVSNRPLRTRFDSELGCDSIA